MFGKYSTTTKKNTYDRAIFLKLRISTKISSICFPQDLQNVVFEWAGVTLLNAKVASIETSRLTKNKVRPVL